MAYNPLEGAFPIRSEEQDKVRHSIQTSSNLSTDWEKPECQREADELVQRLLQPGILNFIAIHEAGHEWYFQNAGCTTVPRSSRITYDPNKKVFAQQLAAIEISNCKAEGDDGLFTMAEGYASGGRCAKRLKPRANYFGDTNDREKFLTLYAEHYLGESGETMWLNAQKSVDKDLRDESLRTRIDKRADKLLPILFPWLRR